MLHAAGETDGHLLPSLDLLAPMPSDAGRSVDRAALERNAQLLATILEDFGLKGRITRVRPGPVVTIYDLEPVAGMRTSRIEALAEDIARHMSADYARIIPCRGSITVGIELPNAVAAAVGLSELIASPAFEDGEASLPIALGMDVGGGPVVADLAAMPHLLVAGTTGSGKSVGLNCVIISLLYRLAPTQCRMIMIDLTMVELGFYDGIPHLLSPVIADSGRATRALRWAVESMEERYRMLSAAGERSLAAVNDRVRLAKSERGRLGRGSRDGRDAAGDSIGEEEQFAFRELPRIVVIVDELAAVVDGLPGDEAVHELSGALHRLSERGRSVGVHLVLASNRWTAEDLDRFTGAKSVARVAYRLSSRREATEFLGSPGAEALGRSGDLLYRPEGCQPVRVHGAFARDEEARAVADHWRGQGARAYVSGVVDEFPARGPDADEVDPFEGGGLYERAVQVVAESQNASTSYVLRQLRLGYDQAARFIERMEREGKIGPPDHVGRREVLIDRDGQAVNARTEGPARLRKSFWPWGR